MIDDHAREALLAESRAVDRAAQAMYRMSNDLSVAGARDLFRAGLAAAGLPAHPDQETELALNELRALGADVPERLRQAVLLAKAGVPTSAVVSMAQRWALGRTW